MKRILFSLLVSAFTFPILSNAQCLETSLPASSSGLINVLETGYPVELEGYANSSEYSLVHLLGGKNYSFFTSIDTDYLTISDENGTSVLAYGSGMVDYSPAEDMDVRIFIHLDADCNTDTAYRRLRGICGTPAVLENCDQAAYTSNAQTGFFSILGGVAFDVSSSENSTLTVSALDLNMFNMDENGEVNDDFTTNIVIHANTENAPGEVLDTIALELQSSVESGVEIYGVPIKTYSFNFPESLVIPENTTYWFEVVTTAFFLEANYQSNFVGSGAYGYLSESLWESYEDYEIVYHLYAECEEEMGIGQNNLSKLEVYPNPVNNLLHLNSKNNQIVNAEIYNLAGQKVWSKFNQTAGELDFSSATAGVYIVKISLDNGKTEIKKVIKK